MENLIYISKPYIDIVGDRAKLCSEINDCGVKRTLYYEVPSEYSKYLVTERLDAFLLGLLYKGMSEAKNIVCETGISEELLFQLKTYFIPVVSSQMPDLSFINIEAPIINEPLTTEGAVGTGNSGGVDSFYTLIKYNSKDLGSFKLTHVIFTNISTADRDDERIRKLFERDKHDKRLIAKELGLIPIELYTNLYSFYESQFIFNYYFTPQYASSSYALGKLFSKYYYSSGVSVSDFSMNHDYIKDSAYYDLFTLDCISTKNLKLYSSGSEVGRVEKTRYISNDKTVQNHLQVCAVEQSSSFYEINGNYLEKLNCGHCTKCFRTISTLYGLGCLEEFENVFDLSYFRKNKNLFLANELARDGKTFLNEIVPLLKKKNQLPISTVILSWFLYVCLQIRSLLSRIKPLKRLYRFIKGRK